MKRTIMLGCLFAALAGPALAGGGLPLAVEDCDTWAESQALARVMAKRHGAAVTFLDSDQAHRFLSAVNAPGSKIVLNADHVAIFSSLETASAMVWLADNVCGGAGTTIGLMLSDANMAAGLAQH